MAYIYCAGESTRRVWKIDPSDMSKVAESAVYGGSVLALASDSTYIYCAGATTQKAWKLDPSDMSKVAESAVYGGTIRALAFDGAYIYCAGATTQKVWKIDPADMSKVAESADYGRTINALTFDGTHIYCAGDIAQKVWKIDPTDMSKVAENAGYGGNIHALASDGAYIYCAGTTVQRVWKIDPADMSKVAESANYGNSLYALASDGTYVYCGGQSTQKVWKIDPSDMSKVAESANYGGTIYALAFDSTHIYCGGYSTRKVWQMDPSDMSKVAESVSYGNTIRALACDEEDGEDLTVSAPVDVSLTEAYLPLVEARTVSALVEVQALDDADWNDRLQVSAPVVSALVDVFLPLLEVLDVSVPVSVSLDELWLPVFYETITVSVPTTASGKDVLVPWELPVVSVRVKTALTEAWQPVLYETITCSVHVSASVIDRGDAWESLSIQCEVAVQAVDRYVAVDDPDPTRAIEILDKAFVHIGFLENLRYADVVKEDSGTWQIKFAAAYESGGVCDDVRRGHYIEVEGQRFTITQAEIIRQGEELWLIGEARHYLFELDEHVYDGEEYQFGGTIAEHITQLLTYQEGTDYQLVLPADTSDDFWAVQRYITHKPGPLSAILQTVCRHFGARLVLDNYKIQPLPRDSIVDSGVVMEYGVQNANVGRAISRDNVVTKLVARCSLAVDPWADDTVYEVDQLVTGDDGQVYVCIAGHTSDEDPPPANTTNWTLDGADTRQKTYYAADSIRDLYRYDIERLVDFGTLASEGDLDWLAAEYLSVYADPVATYELSFAELKEISNISTLYPGRDFAVDVGMSVTVQDSDLGLDLLLPVLRYEYSLLEPDRLSRLTLGKLSAMGLLPEQQYLGESVTTDDAAREARLNAMRRAALEWGNAVVKYAQDVLGGDARRIDPGLLLVSSTTTVHQKRRKTLVEGIVQLARLANKQAVTQDTNRFYVVDPVAEMNTEEWLDLWKAYEIVRRFVVTTTGFQFSLVGSNLVARLNAAYAAAYGVGQTGTYPADTVSSVWGNQWAAGTQEYIYARTILDLLAAQVGNVSGIYLEIGGGNAGIIGSMNDLYRKLTTAGITVSDEDPDDDVGKDGDLWFQYVEEPEEE